MASLVPIDPVSDPAWDKIVSRHPEATIFHTSAWARVLAETYGYKPFYFADASNVQPAALCVFEVDSWLTGRRGIALPFTDECAPLTNGSYSFDALFSHAVELAGEHQWKSIEIRDAVGKPESTSLSFYSHALDLTPGTEALFALLDGSTRRAVRKAEKAGISVSIENGEALNEYFRLHCLTRKKHGLPPQPFRFFESIYRHIIAAGQGFVALAWLNGRAVAGQMFFTRERAGLYKFGASNPEYDSLRPNNLLMWKMIGHLGESGIRTLDFGRTSLQRGAAPIQAQLGHPGKNRSLYQMGLRRFTLCSG